MRESIEAGDFEGAARRASGIPLNTSLAHSELLAIGRIALLQNRLDWAERAFSVALEGDPNAKIASLLGETFYRADAFEAAAPWFRELGRLAMSRKLESFAGSRPYEPRTVRGVRLRFVRTDPLPVVRVRINGRATGNFFVDTGGSELYLDSEFAERVGATRFGMEEGTYAGGKSAPYEHGKVDSVELDRLMVHNVPVHIVPMRNLWGIAGRRRLHGIIGTVFLYHFTPTIDYVGGNLVLRPRKPGVPPSGTAGTACVARIPFWLERDHFMIAHGSVNGRPTMLFLDSGLAGGGFTCPHSTLAEAGIRVPETAAVEGQGGAGGTPARRFVVNRLRLGRADQRNVVGWLGLFPPFLEREFGYRIGGLVSHGFFRNYRVTVDFSRMLMTIER
ncbi:MAG: aspartyl protease family protein [Thermoplasmata archaeon]